MKQRLILAAVFALVPLLHFPRALLLDRTLFARDVGTVWAPQIEAVIRQVARGDLPFFDQKRAFGQPLFADPRAEVLYPPAWMHWVLPLTTSYALFAALHLVIAAVGAARLTRRMAPEAPPAAVAVAGVVYSAGGPLLSLVSHWHHLAAAAWIPWILEAVEKRDQATPWLRIASLVALQVLAGSPDYTLATLAIASVRLAMASRSTSQAGLRLMAALVLGIGLSCVQLLPSLAFARQADRPALPIGWSMNTLHPALAIETVLPVRVESWPLSSEARAELLLNAAPWMFSHYLGLSAVVLAACAWVGTRRPGLRYFTALFIAGLIASIGVRNPMLQEALSHIPFVSGFRFPTKYLAISSLGLAVLAGIGVERLTSGRRLPARVSVAAPLGIATLAVGLFLAVADSAALEWPILVRPAVAIACALVVSRMGASWAIVALAGVDLLVSNSAINPTMPSNLFASRPALTEILPRESRLYVSDYSIAPRTGSLRPPDGPLYEIAKAPPGLGREAALSLAAAWYLHPPMAGRFGYFGSFDLDVLDFYRGPLRRTIEEFAISRDGAFVLDRLRRGSVDFVVTMDPKGLWDTLPLMREERLFFAAPVRVFRVTDSWPKARLESPAAEMVGAVRVVEDRDSRIRIETQGPAADLVVATAFDPGWRATIDGAPATVSENSMALVRVALSEGSHSIELRYEPPLLMEGALLSLVSVLIVGFLTSRSR